MDAKKVIIVSLIVVGIVVFTQQAYSNSLKRKEEDERIVKEKLFLHQMRKKYANIRSWNDFNEGIKYMEFPEKFGYDLRLLNKIKNLDRLIDFDELKFLYNTSKSDVKDMDAKSQDEFLRIMDKIY